MIPNAALAAMLIGVGYELAHPKEFAHAFHIDKEQLVIFLTTNIFTLSVDVLVGVFAGILVKVIFHLGNGDSLSKLFKVPVQVLEQQGNFYVTIEQSAIFTNWLNIKKELEAIPQGAKVYINLGKTKLVDHSVMENLHLFELDYNEAGSQVHLVDLENHKPFSEHKLSVRKN